VTKPLTPSRSFYVRNHFDIPRIAAEAWRLRLEGSVEHPSRFALSDLRALPARDLVVTLECAGNGRRAMDPPSPGIPWGFGAVGTARFTGVPVSALLDRAGTRFAAVEVVFIGADRGRLDSGQIVPFARSLPIEVARHPDTLVAVAMNGRPLSAEHGFPARLIVPCWYAMASVKWLVGIQVVDVPFEGYFQKDEYVYVGDDGASPSEPVTLMRVRAVIGAPRDGEEVPPGPVKLAGAAWSGHPPVVRVDLSVDEGATWRPADLGPAPSPYAARRWRCSLRLDRPGSYSIVVRATDQEGNSQPYDPLWNERGYGNNVTHRVRLNVTSARSQEQDEVPVVRGGPRDVRA
jgi:DMSO/TMAO reductase YedYZ molybdopterin-dependent catalytic subunit